MLTRLSFSLFLTVLLGGCAVQDSGDLDTVPRRLAEELASGQIYLGIPEGFPEFTLPQGVKVQGGLDRNFNNFVLILASEMSLDAFEDAVLASLKDAGWVALTAFPGQPSGGFQGIQGRPFNNPPEQLCHDRYGIMSVNERNRLGIHTRLSLDWNYNVNDPAGFNCAAQEAQRLDRFMPRIPTRELNQYMPILELPPEDRGSRFRPFFGGGSSGSGDALTTRSPLVVDWDMDEIVDWFADQLEDQDWEEDVTWEGATSAGSSWRRQVTEAGNDIGLVGLLDVIHIEEDNYELRFRVSYRQR